MWLSGAKTLLSPLAMGADGELSGGDELANPGNRMAWLRDFVRPIRGRIDLVATNPIGDNLV